MKLEIARQLVEAVGSHEFEIAEAFLDPEVETVTPRTTFRGIAACRNVLARGSNALAGRVTAAGSVSRRLGASACISPR